MESMKELFSIINQVAQSTAHSQTLFNWTQTNPLCLLHKKKYYTKFFSTYGIRVSIYPQLFKSQYTL